MFISYIIDNL